MAGGGHSKYKEEVIRPIKSSKVLLFDYVGTIALYKHFDNQWGARESRYARRRKGSLGVSIRPEFLDLHAALNDTFTFGIFLRPGSDTPSEIKHDLNAIGLYDIEIFDSLKGGQDLENVLVFTEKPVPELHEIFTVFDHTFTMDEYYAGCIHIPTYEVRVTDLDGMVVFEYLKKNLPFWRERDFLDFAEEYYNEFKMFRISRYP